MNMRAASGLLRLGYGDSKTKREPTMRAVDRWVGRAFFILFRDFEVFPFRKLLHILTHRS